MKKIKSISKDQLNQLKNSNNPTEVFKEILELPINSNYRMGDTAIRVNNANVLDIFKDTYANKEQYYIVVEVIDEEVSFAYSLYPCN